MSAVDFWNVYGSHCPELTSFAIPILSSHVTSSACERGWNRYKFIKGKRRGRLHHSRVEKSQYIAINSRLEQPLDEEDDAGVFAQWTDEDEAFHVFSRGGASREAEEPTTATKFNCWEEEWELEARKDTPLNRFKVQEKFIGVYLYEQDPDDEEEEDSDDISDLEADSSGEQEEEKKTEDEKPPIGECRIASIYWKKGARASQKVWRAVARKVIQDQTGEWVEAKKENGDPIEYEYYLNYSIYPMVQASSLNTHLDMVIATHI